MQSGGSTRAEGGITDTIQWESICQTGLPGGDRLWRARVPGGWLALFEDCHGNRAGLTFMPDPNHAWRASPARESDEKRGEPGSEMSRKPSGSGGSP